MITMRKSSLADGKQPLCAGEMSPQLKDPEEKPLLADRNVCVLLPDVGPGHILTTVLPCHGYF